MRVALDAAMIAAALLIAFWLGYTTALDDRREQQDTTPHESRCRNYEMGKICLSQI